MGIEGEPKDYLGIHKSGIFERLLPLYNTVLEYLPKVQKSKTILDVGCGVGMFTEVLFKSNYSDYVGIDFSPTVIEIAKKRVPEAKFIVADLRDSETRKNFKQYSIFIMLEVLEHINDDLNVLKAIPSNSLVIFSVPSFDDPFHVRHFNSVNSVIKRYESLIKFNKSKTIGHRFLFSCIRH